MDMHCSADCSVSSGRKAVSVRAYFMNITTQHCTGIISSKESNYLDWIILITLAPLPALKLISGTMHWRRSKERVLLQARNTSTSTTAIKIIFQTREHRWNFTKQE